MLLIMLSPVWVTAIFMNSSAGKREGGWMVGFLIFCAMLFVPISFFANG